MRARVVACPCSRCSPRFTDEQRRAAGWALVPVEVASPRGSDELPSAEVFAWVCSKCLAHRKRTQHAAQPHLKCETPAIAAPALHLPTALTAEGAANDPLPDVEATRYH